MKTNAVDDSLSSLFVLAPISGGKRRIQRFVTVFIFIHFYLDFFSGYACIHY